ncbi:MAG: NRAMP family divalent metal transporter [Thermoplasmata archaeon]
MNPRIRKLLPILGPGWVVMMADLDAPSVITAVESGIQFKAHLIVLLIILIVPLFLVQDTASRIGAVTGKTLGQLMTSNFGHKWTVTAVSGSAIIDFAAYVGEFAGIAAAAEVLGIPVFVAVIAVILIHSLVIMTGTYKKIEVLLVALGSLLFAFIILDFFMRPSIVNPSSFFPVVPESSFYFLVAANIGAVIMPWMLFYHQAADVDRGLKISEMKRESRGTLLGAVVSEVLMISIVIFSWRLSELGLSSGSSLESVSNALGSIIGPAGPFIFSIGVGVAGLLAMFVISMSMSYTISDALKWKGSFNGRIREQKGFYSVYLVEIIPAAIIILTYPNLVAIVLDVMVFTSVAVALPLMVVTRIASNPRIMGKYRISKVREVSLYVILALIVSIGMYSIITSFIA